MKQMKTRLTALVLALTMMLSCSIHVFAANDGTYALDEDLIYEIDYETELDLGACMIEDLEILMKDDLDYVTFDIPADAGGCGEIYYHYATNQWEELDDTKKYYAYPSSAEYALDEVYFESNDDGGEYWFEYKAVDEDADVLEGTVTICVGENQENALPVGAKYTIDSVAVRSPYTDSLLGAIPANDFYAEVAVTNLSHTGTALLLLAVYAENGEMIDLAFLYADPDMGKSVTFGTLIRNADGRAYRIKAFLWTSLIDPVPLAEAKAFPAEDDGLPHVLLTDAYCETNRNGTAYAVEAMMGGEVNDYDVDPASDIAAFIDDSDASTNGWNRLIPYAGDKQATTNVAAYTMDDSGALRLQKSENTFLDLEEEPVKAGQITYSALYKKEDVKVQATENTVFYYVNHVGDERQMQTVTGYPNSLPVNEKSAQILSMYAVARGDAHYTGEVPYWVADIIVIETATAATDGTLNSALSGTVKAAQVMNFADSLTAFENLGDNDNVYITIDSLPTHGRLVYKWGTAQQEEVEVGEKFYLSKTAKRMLSDLTYVPAYSADKTIKTDTFAVTGVSAGGNEVEGTVNLTIEHAQKSALFTDVTDSYYADSVDFVRNQNISAGMTASTFGLTGDVTRGQFVTFLYRAAGSPRVTGVANNFTDVSTSDYYYYAIMWAVKNSLVSGTSASTFAPADTLTRQQALTFLFRFSANYLGREIALGSPDGITDYADVGEWAQVPVRWAVAHGFVGDGALEPESVLDRGTTAIYLHGALTGMAGATQPDPEPETEPYTALVYGIAINTPPDHIELDAIASDGTKKTLTVTEADGEPVTDAALITLPAFYEVTDNGDGTVSLSHITGDFAKYGIYAGQVRKYVLSSNSILLNDEDLTELTESPSGFTLYDGNFDVEATELLDVEKKTDYIFFAPEEEVIYGITADKQALQKLFVRLGGLQDTAADYGDSYFIDPDARDAINLLYDIDLMLGHAVGNYHPDGTVTRAEVAKMIYEILHYGEDDRGEAYTDLNLFTDVASADWYSGYVNYCAASGLMGGKADGTFAPYETVTCPQMAKILLQAIGYDAEARGYVGANWADAVLSDAAILGLLEDYKYNTLTTVPRQWMAVMIANALRNCYTYTGDAPVKFTTLVTKEMAAADRKSYVLMGDKYYGLGLDPAPELTLLVNGYCETNRNGKVYAVEATVDGEVGEYDVNPNSDIAAFLDDSNTGNYGWNRLIPYAGDEDAITNVAEYTLDADGMMSLYETRKTLIDLYEEDAEARETAYYGDYTDENGELLEDVCVQANKGTVYYYVDAERNAETVTSYKNSYDVFDAQHGIRAMYAVATDIAGEGEDPYFVADIIVIETEESVTQPVSQSLVLVYDYSINKKGVVTMDVFAADGTRQSLTVDEIDGRDPANARISTPAFYDCVLYSNNTRTLESVKYPEKRGACAGVVESFDGSDVILSDGTTLTASAAGFTHYRYNWNDNTIFAESNLLTSLYPKEPYLFYAPDGEAVYAIQASSPDLRELYGTAGGHRPETDATTLFLDGSTVDPAARDAVELMYELGLMNSNGKGYFHPNATFTRAEMAKLIYVLLNYGHDDNAVNYRGATFFSDVEADSWYEGYVNYCASIKLIQGQDGTFGPNEAISGVKAAKMLLTAIGYSAEERGYIPGTALWEDNVLCDAEIIGLLEDYCGPTTSATSRQWVAKLVENCMNCLTYDRISPPIGSPLPPTEPVTIPMGEKYFDLTEDSEIYRRVYNVMTEPEVVLGYSVTNKTTADYVSLDAVDADAVLQELAVVELDGENAKDAAFAVPAFFLSTENADGEASLTTLTEDFGGYGICAATVTKVNDLYGYVTTEEDEVLYFSDEVVVYDLYATTRYMKLTTEDENGDQLELTPGQSYILIADGEDIVYALLVQNADDPAAALYAQICGKELPAAPDNTPADEELLTLLTDAYFDSSSGKVYAYAANVMEKDGQPFFYDGYAPGEYTANPASDIDAFIDDSDTGNYGWNRLIPYSGDEKATTNVAAYTLDGDGVLSLYETKKAFIDLYEEDAEASQKSYYGDYTDENGVLNENICVKASDYTIFYYVDAQGNVQQGTGRTDSHDVIAYLAGIRAMYAIATDYAEEGEEPDFVADVIVIETEEMVPISVDLCYNAVSVDSEIYPGVLDALDGYGHPYPVHRLDNNTDFTLEMFSRPAFYLTSKHRTADGGITVLTTLTENFAGYGIYAGPLDEVNAHTVTSADGMQFDWLEGTNVYDLEEGGTYTQLASVPQMGEHYILYTENGEVVYAVLVQNADDPAAALYTQICGRELPPVNTDQQTADQIAAELQPVTVEIDQIAAVKDAVYAALTAQNGNASYDVVLPDFSLDGAAGKKTLEGVLVTVQVGEATAQTTISITVLY